MANSDKFTGKDIDEILDEIEERERKQNAESKSLGVDWKRIREEIKNKNIHYIKNMITSKDIAIDSQNPEDGKTLLIYAVIIGDVDLVTVLCNFGANSKIKDHQNMDALDHAKKYGIYKITELVYFRSMSSGLGNDLKSISKETRRQTTEAVYMLSVDQELCRHIVKFVTQAITDRAPLDETMLFYAWYFVTKTAENSDDPHWARYDPLQHPLWKAMMSTYEAILTDTSDKAGWQWLKDKFVNSYIWFQPNPNPNPQELHVPPNWGSFEMIHKARGIELHSDKDSKFSTAIGNLRLTEGKWYYEVHLIQPANWCYLGWGTHSQRIESDFGCTGHDDRGWSYYQGGGTWHCGKMRTYGKKWSVGDVLGFAIDIDAKKMNFYQNGQDLGVAFTDFDVGDGIAPSLSVSKAQRILYVSNPLHFKQKMPEHDYRPLPFRRVEKEEKEQQETNTDDKNVDITAAAPLLAPMPATLAPMPAAGAAAPLPLGTGASLPPMSGAPAPPPLIARTGKKNKQKYRRAEEEKEEDTKRDEEEEEDVNDDTNEIDGVLRHSLFYELLSRVRDESKKQSDLLLKTKVDAIKCGKPQDWKQLIAYDVNSEYAKNARQDVCGCLPAKYSASDLERYPPSTHFSAKKHYDTNMYLSELLFVANVMDSSFQLAMKRITKEINQMTAADNEEAAIYRAGPVKTLTRSQAKVENDYINEAWPTSAKILDINRCAIQFKSISQMMQYLELFTAKIEKKETGCIQQVIRCKNGWSVYNEAYPQYTDVKLNVLVQTHDTKIIAEIQFLLDLMSAFKKKAHKLYSVERKFELVYNYRLLTKTISEFKDLQNVNEVVENLVLEDNLDNFRDLWQNIRTDFRLLTNISSSSSSRIVDFSTIFHLLLPDHDRIHNYLLHSYQSLYAQSILYMMFRFFAEQYKNGKYRFFLKLFNEVILQIPKFKKLSVQDGENLLTGLIAKMLHVLGLQQPSTKSTSYKEMVQYLRVSNIVNDASMYLRPRNAFNYYALSAPHHGTAYNDTQFRFEMTRQHRAPFSTFHIGDTIYNYNSLPFSTYHAESVYRKGAVLELKEHSFTTVALCDYHALGIDANSGSVKTWSSYNTVIGVGIEEFIDTVSRTDYGESRGTVVFSLEPFGTAPAKAVCCGSAHCLVLLANGKLYGFGVSEDSDDKLGHKGAYRPQLIEQVGHLTLRDETFTDIAGGHTFNVAIGGGEKVLFVWGRICSHLDVHDFYHAFGKQDFGDSQPEKVRAGSQSALVLTSKGQCYVFGYAHKSYGLGLGEDVKQQLVEKPQLIALPEESLKIVDIAAGQNHWLCVTTEGDVYSWGSNEQGQLGHGDPEKVGKREFEPKRIEAFRHKNIKIASCWAGNTASSSAVVDREGGVWLFGMIPSPKHLFPDAEKEEFADYLKAWDGPNTSVYIPMRIDTLSESAKIIQIAFSDRCAMFLTQNGGDSKEKEDEKEKEAETAVYYLRANETRKLDAKSYDHDVSLRVYAKNEQLFPNSDWNLLSQRMYFQSDWHRYSSAFVDNLEMVNGDEIVLKNASDIAVKYHTEILQSKYVLLSGNECVIDAQSVKKDQVRVFESVEEIRFQFQSLEQERKHVSVYHQPEENGAFILLKSFEGK